VLKILRAKETATTIGTGKTKLYGLIKDGVFPPSIKIIGSASVGWLSTEVETIIKAYAAGKSKDELKLIVTGLVNARGQM